MSRDLSSYDRETHTLYIREGASVEEMAAVFEETPKDEVLKLRNAVLRIVATSSLEKALGDGRAR